MPLKLLDHTVVAYHANECGIRSRGATHCCHVDRAHSDASLTNFAVEFVNSLGFGLFLKYPVGLQILAH